MASNETSAMIFKFVRKNLKKEPVRQMAERLDIGKSELSRIENQHKKPSHRVLGNLITISGASSLQELIEWAKAALQLKQASGSS